MTDLAKLEAQRAHFAGDRHILEEVAMWADATPSERLAACAALCEEGDRAFARLPQEVQDRLRAIDRFPSDTLALMARAFGR
ncbi:MAG: hypothetical protein NT062_33400 [Proteobacteria bacterium]|nr:hypothetical protein [Pseudomonadota bacterium]